jgi:hypothetical protein
VALYHVGSVSVSFDSVASVALLVLCAVACRICAESLAIGFR